jgi:hypothetical protein
VVESNAVRFLDKRLAELSQQYESRTHPEIAEELSELSVIRDQLITALQMPKELQLSKHFPTLGAFMLQINTLARQIARTRKGDPQRHELLNEMTWLCLIAAGSKREL